MKLENFNRQEDEKKAEKIATEGQLRASVDHYLEYEDYLSAEQKELLKSCELKIGPSDLNGVAGNIKTIKKIEGTIEGGDKEITITFDDSPDPAIITRATENGSDVTDKNKVREMFSKYRAIAEIQTNDKRRAEETAVKGLEQKN